MKKGLKLGCESKLSHRSQALFQFALQTRTAAPSGLPLGWVVRCRTPFCCGKTSGERAVARYPIQLVFLLTKKDRLLQDGLFVCCHYLVILVM